MVSQFLVCKSKNNMEDYATSYKKILNNKNLISEVVQTYMNGVDDDDIWVVETIHNTLSQLSENIDFIGEISEKSDIMIFWYGSEYKGLKKIYSKEELTKYLFENIDNPCIELDLYVDIIS